VPRVFVTLEKLPSRSFCSVASDEAVAFWLAAEPIWLFTVKEPSPCPVTVAPEVPQAQEAVSCTPYTPSEAVLGRATLYA
jgi:hypothetical protein